MIKAEQGGGLCKWSRFDGNLICVQCDFRETLVGELLAAAVRVTGGVRALQIRLLVG